jgi:hypothetical protein
MFCGLIILFITSYNTEEINQLITDVFTQPISKSITNYMLKYNRGYFKLLGRKSIAGFIREDSRE